MRHVKRLLRKRALTTAFGMTLASTTFGGTCILFSQLAYAQATQPNQAGADSVEEIVVTGSRLATSATTAPTIVTSLTAQELTFLSPQTLPDALNKLPEFQNSVSPAKTQTNLTNSQGAVGNLLNLRGLGTNRTLIMLDGVRVPPTDAAGDVNIDILPQALVQRVDVVTGGASAAYGSDAVVGAVNFILDKNFTGFKASVQGGVSSRGDSQSYKADLTGGLGFADNRGHILADVSTYHNYGIDNRADRPGEYSTYGGKGTAANPFVQYPSGGTIAPYSNGGTIGSGPLAGDIFLPGGTVAPAVPGMPTGNGLNAIGGTGGIFANNGFTPDEVDNNFFARVSYDVTPNITAYIQGTYADNDQSINGINALAFAGTSQGLTIFNNNAYLQPSVLAGLGNTPSFAFSRVSIDMPPLAIDSHTDSSIVQTGLSGPAWGSWKWDATYVYGYNRFRGSSREEYLPNLYAAVDAVVNPANGQTVCNVTLTNPGAYPGCVPINLFGLGAPSAAAINYVMGDSTYNIDNKMQIGNANLRGNLFDDWAGPIAAAIGAEFRSQSLTQTSNSNPAIPYDFSALRGVPASAVRYINSNTGVSAGSVNVKEGYGEVQIPLARNVPWAVGLDLNGAARYTDYSTSGSVVTWKTGLSYQPIVDLRLRATVSRDILAPSLYDLYQGLQLTRTGALDPLTGVNSDVLQQSSGNKNLQPEKGKTYTGGFTYTPRWAHGLTVDADVYDITIKDAITTSTANQELINCQNSAPLFNDPACALIIRPFPVTNTTPENYPTAIIVNPLNEAQLKQSGIDLKVNYDIPAGDLFASWKGIFDLTGAGTFVLSAKNQTAENLPFITTLGVGTTEKKSGLFQIGYTLDPLSVHLTNRFTGASAISYQQVYTPNVWPNRVYTDLAITYQVQKAVQAFFTVENMFNVSYPIVNSANPYVGFADPTNRAIYDVVGTYFTVGVRVRL